MVVVLLKIKKIKFAKEIIMLVNYVEKGRTIDGIQFTT